MFEHSTLISVQVRHGQAEDQKHYFPQASSTIMSITHKIENKLNEAFRPLRLEVIDESEQHRGHGGWKEGGETHFRVKIVSEKFSGMNRLARHRAIHDALEEELKGAVHALVIEVSAPHD